MGTYYDKDIDLSPIKNKRIAIVGFGAQGRSHALNLKDSGCDVVVALRADSASMTTATSMGLPVEEIELAIASADIVMFLSPDSSHPKIYREYIAPFLKPKAMMMFAHGYNIHYETLVPREDIDVTMVAPLGIGDQVRAMFVQGAGVAALLAIHQNVSGQAKEISLAYAAANGHGRAGIIETTFSEETETDLFAEQAILCGGITHLIEAGFETLVEAGYQPELAYFSCLHELKLIIDLIYSRGIAGMRQSISQTAEFGDYTRGPRVINETTREEMRAMLKEIQSGSFAKELANEISAQSPVINKGRAASIAHPITAVGERLRSMMPWMRVMSVASNTVIARDGWPFIFIGLLLIAIALRFGLLWLVVLSIVYMVAVFLLFRDPYRDVPSIPLAIVSPVDGHIQDIRRIENGLLNRSATVISIKLHKIGAYTTRSPTEGKIMSLSDLEAGSRGVQTNGLWIRTDEGDDVVLLMKGDAISNLYPAVADVRYGERIGQGERVGLNRLTQTAHLYLADTANLAISVGDKVYAGSTVLAEYYRGSTEVV